MIMPGKALILTLLLTGSVLPALAADKVTSPRPDGAGDPDATTCRPPQPLPASRFTGPEVCKTNSQWALLRKNNQDISADGTKIIPDPHGAGMNLQCSVSGGGASSGGGAMTCH
jgi:hypothetical protein